MEYSDQIMSNSKESDANIPYIIEDNDFIEANPSTELDLQAANKGDNLNEQNMDSTKETRPNQQVLISVLTNDSSIDEEAQFVKSSKGNDQLLYRGYVYHRDKQRLFTIYWRCRFPGCMGRAKSMGKTVVATRNHTHDPNTHPTSKAQTYVINNSNRRRSLKWKNHISPSQERKEASVYVQRSAPTKSMSLNTRDSKMLRRRLQYNKIDSAPVFREERNNSTDFYGKRNQSTIKLESDEFTTPVSITPVPTPIANWSNIETGFPNTSSHLEGFRQPRITPRRLNTPTSAMSEPSSICNSQINTRQLPPIQPATSHPSLSANNGMIPTSTVAGQNIAASPSILEVIGALAVLRRFCEDRSMDLDSLQHLEKSIARNELEGLLRR